MVTIWFAIVCRHCGESHQHLAKLHPFPEDLLLGLGTLLPCPEALLPFPGTLLPLASECCYLVATLRYLFSKDCYCLLKPGYAVWRQRYFLSKTCYAFGKLCTTTFGLSATCATSNKNSTLKHFRLKRDGSSGDAALILLLCKGCFGGCCPRLPPYHSCLLWTLPKAVETVEVVRWKMASPLSRDWMIILKLSLTRLESEFLGITYEEFWSNRHN